MGDLVAVDLDAAGDPVGTEASKAPGAGPVSRDLHLDDDLASLSSGLGAARTRGARHAAPAA